MSNGNSPGASSPEANRPSFGENLRNVVDRITGAGRQMTERDEAHREAERRLNPEQIQRFRSAEEIIARVERADNQFYRQMNLEKRFGTGGFAEFKQFLSGEADFELNRNGEVIRNAGNEVLRKFLHTFVNRRNVIGAGVALVAGALTGGFGWAMGGALLGAAGGRGAAEAWESIAGEERKLREQIAILEFEHAQAMKDLAKKRRELLDQKKSDEANKITHQIVDMFYQDSEAIVQGRSRLADTKSQWDKRRGTLTMIGGFTGAAAGAYHGFSHLAETAAHTKSAITSGYVDFNGDGTFHHIQKINDTWYYIYNSAKEIAQGKAFAVQHGYDLTISALPNTIGGHVLPGVTDQMIIEASKHAGTYSALWPEIGKAAAVLGAAFLAGVGSTKKDPTMDASFSEAERKIVKDKLTPLKEEKKEEEKKEKEEKEEEKVEPQVGQHWIFPSVVGAFRSRNFNEIINDFMELPNPNDTNNPNHIFFGTYRIDKVDGDKITLIRMDDQNPAMIFQRDNQASQRRITLNKEDLQKYGRHDTQRVISRGYQQNWEQLATHLGNRIPKTNEVWQFDIAGANQFNPVFGNAAINIPGGSASRWLVVGIKNNMIEMHQLEPGSDRPIPQTVRLNIHMVDILYIGRPERNERDTNLDRQLLERLGVKLDNYSGARFRSPNVANLTDYYRNAVLQNTECQVTNINLEGGMISLQAVRGVNRVRPTYVIRIQDLVGVNPWQLLDVARPTVVGQDGVRREGEAGERRNSWDDFTEILVNSGVVDAGDRKDIKKEKSIFESRGVESVVMRFIPDPNDPDGGTVILQHLELRPRQQGKGQQQSNPIEDYHIMKGPANREIESITNFINYNYVGSSETIKR